jgi:exonuclease SbcC
MVDDELEHAVSAHSQVVTSLAQADAVERDAREQQALCRQAVDRLHEQLEQAEQQSQTALNTLLVDVNGYRTDPCSANSLPQALNELKDRRDTWTTKTSELDAFARNLPALQTELRYTVQQVEQTTQARDAANTLFVDLQAQHASLRDQRNALYGDGHPDDEEKELARAIELFQQSQEQLLTTHSALTARKDSLAKQEGELRATLSQQQAQLDEARNRFNQALEQRGLNDEQSYLQARLEAREREALQERSRQLEQRQAALRTHHAQTLAKLNAVQGKQLWLHSEQELDQRRTHTQQLIQAAMQELGAINQQLAAHAQQLSEQRDKMLALQQHQEICRQWDKLHDLIGSADGKKYRNFAQGLTFDVMIGYANRQLAKMSDRYLLVRDTTQMLDLNVIDNHQGAQVRPTRNLSGGESFLVSLALALGLSSMSSRNVRVDSLFLDEGFGTLDEDALDTALETLSGLHQEGKLIGVISHIPALKDRIGVQIQVTPVSGGCSRLSGPGCSGPG